MAEGATTAFQTLGNAVTFMWEQFTEMATTMLSTPIFLIPLAIFVIGAAIGLVKRIL